MKLVLRSARTVTAVSVSLLNLPIVSDLLLLLSKIDSDLKRKRCDTEERFAFILPVRVYFFILASPSLSSSSYKTREL